MAQGKFKKTTVSSAAHIHHDVQAGTTTISQTERFIERFFEPYVRGYTFEIFSLRFLNGTERVLLDFLSHNAVYNTNVCVFDTEKRKMFKEGVGVGGSTVVYGLQSLIEKGFIQRKSRGMFIVNPRVYFKGEDKARDKMLKDGDWWLHGEARKEILPEGPVEPKREKRKKAIQPNEQF